MKKEYLTLKDIRATGLPGGPLFQLAHYKGRVEVDDIRCSWADVRAALSVSMALYLLPDYATAGNVRRLAKALGNPQVATERHLGIYAASEIGRDRLEEIVKTWEADMRQKTPPEKEAERATKDVKA